MRPPASQPVELAPDEALRVLFVFAEARGSRPLGARQERLELLRLFEQKIYPRRRIVAHFLSHGVTRARLEAQIRDNGGYHVVHWSGHGHLNLLELAKPGGAQDQLSGDELLDLFTHAGGFVPRLVFLSACHSGDLVRVKDWADFSAIAQGQEPGTTASAPKDLDFARPPGFTGTAHALLQGGVPSIVAMRYSVGDDYARALAVEFYRALLAHPQPKDTAAALTLARQALLPGGTHDDRRFAVCDHATPVLYGAEQPGLVLATGRSPALNPRNPRLYAITELTTAGHEHFVGRTWELAWLGADFIGAGTSADVKPVAVVTGLGGMGKTALVAEALALWESRFEWVLLYQAKSNALGFEATLRDINIKLRNELCRYHDHVMARPADAVYRDASSEFTGPDRLARLTRNLIRALRDEPILLVLDNFETTLKAEPETAGADGQPVWACQDPAWDSCLAALAGGLVGSPSRVLITSRRPLAALASGVSHPVPLGPLHPAEAALFLRAHPALSAMVFGKDAAEQALARRLLTASRFHPLLMDRLARLAADQARRPQLLEALDTLEHTKDFAQLPALFATAPGNAKELAYLDDALAASLDRLIHGAGPDARCVLWTIAVANDPVALGLLRSVWSGPPEPPARPTLETLLRHLVGVGLATEERTGPEDDNPNLTCHELVRERIRAWMAQNPADRAALTENAIRLAYAERLEAAFEALLHEDMSAALEAGSRALVYCVQAGAWDRLGSFASLLVISTRDPRLLEELLPHLQSAAESAPEGEPRWTCLCYLADALRIGGRPDLSLPYYEQAATPARAAEGAGSRQAWADLAMISGNWANALRVVGDLDAARQRCLDAAAAHKEAGSPAIHVVASELEALRIDIMQGQVAAARPAVEERLAQVEAWWHQHRTGRTVPEAPDAEDLARVLISALDIANDVHRAQNDWESALRRTDAVLAVQRALHRPAEDIAGTRMNRAVELGQLRRFDEARAELEACLQVFVNDPAATAKVLSSLAELFYKQDDVSQAIIQQRRALSLREQLPDPADRAVSHNNLANYLNRSGTRAALAEAPRHQLADLTYCLVAGLGQSLQTSRHNYAIHFRRARAAGTPLAVPRVAELLADPAFYPLDQWLRQRQVNADALQADVDRFLEQARQAALDEP